MRITREASYVEEVDAEIVADDEMDAYAQAVMLGDGENVPWPVIHRYNTHARQPISHSFIKAEFGMDDDEEIDDT